MVVMTIYDQSKRSVAGKSRPKAINVSRSFMYPFYVTFNPHRKTYDVWRMLMSPCSVGLLPQPNPRDILMEFRHFKLKH